MRISVNYLEEILAGAGSLQALAEHKGDIKKRIQDLEVKRDGIIDEETLYDMGKMYGIQKGFIDAYLARRFPSKEAQWARVKDLGSVLTPEALIKVFETELLEELRKASPAEDFESDNYLYSTNIYRVRTVNVERRDFLRRIIRKQEKVYDFLAVIDNSGVILKDPFFTEVCSRKLKELKGRFPVSKGYELQISVDYAPADDSD